jgi:hypothetical protein
VLNWLLRKNIDNIKTIDFEQAWVLNLHAFMLNRYVCVLNPYAVWYGNYAVQSVDSTHMRVIVYYYFIKKKVVQHATCKNHTHECKNSHECENHTHRVKITLVSRVPTFPKIIIRTKWTKNLQSSQKSGKWRTLKSWHSTQGLRSWNLLKDLFKIWQKLDKFQIKLVVVN